MGRLINACPLLVLPYVSPILKALVAKLRIAPTLQITAAGPPGTATTKATLVQGNPLLGSCGDRASATGYAHPCKVTFLCMTYLPWSRSSMYQGHVKGLWSMPI